MTPRFDDPTVRFSTRAHVDEPPLPRVPADPKRAPPRSHHGQSPQGRQGQAPRPQWVAGQVHRQYVSPPGRATPRLASRIDARSNARGRSYRGERRRADRPFPFLPSAVGRKKIRIERIADERNRQVRSRTDRTLTPRAFAGRTRESSHKALVSPRETFRTRVEPDDAFSESETAGRNADASTS